MKMSIILLAFLFAGATARSQNFSGDWHGNITRDYGNEIKTDSIEIHLEQTGRIIRGFSVLHISPGVYIKSVLKGVVQESSKLLRLTETKLEFSNVPDRGQEVFLDRYLLYYDLNEPALLTGKSVASNPRVIYSRSKMQLQKVQI